MIRDVDLVDYYLPPFMQKYNEPVAALKAEEAEFLLIWKAAERVLYNRFISTADEYGISRFEKLLGIYPSEEDTLDSRRSMVLSKWMNQIPYTYGALITKLDALCGVGGYEITPYFDRYTIRLITHSVKNIVAVETLLNELVPCNIIVDISNEIGKNVSAKLTVGASVTVCKHITIGG